MSAPRMTSRLTVWLLIALGTLFFSTRVQAGEQSGNVIVRVEEFSFSGVVKDGNFIYTEVTGKIGVGASEDEAKANLSVIRIGQDPSGKSVLFVDQPKPYRGVHRIYLDASSGPLRPHPAMWKLFNVGDLESSATAGDTAAIEKLADFLSDESALVRLHAAEAIGRTADDRAVSRVKAALATEENNEIKRVLENTIKQLESAKRK